MSPTVGRVVHYFRNLPPAGSENRPFAAIIASVLAPPPEGSAGEGEVSVNLAVFGSSGEGNAHCGVLFVESADDAPEPGRPYCTWPARVEEKAPAKKGSK